RRLDRAGDRDVADGAVANGEGGDLLALARLGPLADGEPHVVAAEDVALVGEVDRRQLDVLLREVLPDVELGPVGQREDADVLALVMAPVVKTPQLRALVLGVPLAELVAEGEHPLLSARLLLVTAGPAADAAA